MGLADNTPINQTILNQAIPSQAIPSQSIPSQSIPSQTVPNQATPNQPTPNQPPPTQPTHPPPPTWLTPVDGRLSSPSGTRHNPLTGKQEFHDGIDIAVPVGTRIFAPRAGEVIAAGYMGGYGNYMEISHENGYISFYGHLSRAVAEVGASVGQGAYIADSGNSGRSTGPHLHFGIFKDGQFVDPLTRISP